MVRKVETDVERFWRRVDRNGPLPAARPDLGRCWLWLGSDIRGYGQFSIGSRTDGTRGQVKAHRFAYELEEPIPDGLTLDHLCRTTLCVRKSHLEPVTSRVNTMRGNTVVVVNARKTHCKRGHPFDAPSAVGKARICRPCAAMHQAAFRSRQPRKPITNAQRAKNREYMRAHRERKRLQQTALTTCSRRGQPARTA